MTNQTHRVAKCDEAGNPISYLCHDEGLTGKLPRWAQNPEQADTFTKDAAQRAASDWTDYAATKGAPYTFRAEAAPVRTVSRRTVMMHGFHRLDENNELCRDTGKPVVSEEHTDDTPDAWNVWARLDFASGEPFDSDPIHDRDFANYYEALSFAETIAAALDCELDEY